MTTTSPKPTSITATDIEKLSQSEVEQSPIENHNRSIPAKRSIWSSIRLKATLLAVAIGVIPVVAIGATAYYFADQSIKEKISLEQKQKTEELADKLNLFMFERFGDIQVMSNLPLLVDPKVRTVLPPEEKQATLDRYAEIYGVYDSIVVADLNGNVLIQAGKEQAPGNIAFREYFKQARAGRVFISEPEASKTTGKLSVFFAAPLRDKVTGEIFGIVQTRMPGERLERLAKNYISGKQEYLFASASGNVFSAREADDINKEATGLFPTISPFVAQEQPGTIFTSNKGETLLVGFAPVVKFENMPPLGWSVLTIADSDVIFKAQRDLLLILASGTMIAAALVGAIAALVANRGTRPILQASSAVEKLGQGDLDTRIPVTGSDELAVLGSNINQMAGQIQSLLGNLRESAAEIEQQKEAVVQESEVLQADVGHILDVVSAVEDGDLTVQAEVSDRATGLVSDTLNRLIEELAQTLGQVLQTAQQVTKGAKNLEDMNSVVATNSDQQSQSIADVLNLTEDVEKIAKESSENAIKANQSLLTARAAVEKGQVSINSLNEGFEVLQRGMNTISKRTEELQAFINLADQFAQEQGQVASMTQMLSLSAEQLGAKALAQQDPQEFRKSGLEFKAIANQIGDLSKQAFAGLSGLKKQSAEVHTLISGVNKDVRDLAQLVAGFDTIVTESNQAFSNVQTTTEQVVEVGNTVEQSSQKIVEASQSTAQAMRNIAQLAERTAQLTQTTQVQSEAMGNLSEQLLKSVQFFRLPEQAIAPTDASHT
jgi:methyl-accepting chemotaxis protein PixJ